MTEQDQLLRVFLGPPDRRPDEAFVQMVRQQVLLEQRLIAVRRESWRKFGQEVLASGAFVILLVLLSSRPQMLTIEAGATTLSPIAMLLILFGTWAAAALRPASQAT